MGIGIGHGIETAELEFFCGWLLLFPVSFLLDLRFCQLD